MNERAVRGHRLESVRLTCTNTPLRPDTTPLSLLAVAGQDTPSRLDTVPSAVVILGAEFERV